MQFIIELTENMRKQRGIIGSTISGENANFFSLLDLVTTSLITSSFFVIMTISYAFTATIVAKARGGKGEFTKFVYLVSTYTAPIIIGSSCILRLLATDALLLALSIWSLPIAVGILLLYFIILGTVGLKTVSKLSWGNALISSSMFPLLILMTFIGPSLIRILDSVRIW